MFARLFPALPFTVLIALCAFGAANRSIWYDEAITLQTLAADRFVMGTGGAVTIGEIARHFEGATDLPELVRRYAETDVHPPLYFVLVHVAGLVFGGGLMVARLVSLALIAGAVVIFWRLLGHLRVADRVVYAGVFALSFAAVSSAQDARGYALAILLTTAVWGLSVLADGMRGPARLRTEAGIGVLCALLLYTHYFTLFAVAPILGWRLVQGLVQRNGAVLLGPILCAVLFAPWVPVMLAQMDTRPGQMTGFAGIVDWIRATSNLVPAQVFTPAYPGVEETLQARIRDVVLLAMIAGTLAGLWRWRRTDGETGLARLAIWVPATGLLLFLAASVLLDRWLVTFRYFLFFAPFFAFLAAGGALWLGRALERGMGGERPALRLVPGFALIAAQAAALNFGWEAIGARGGNYFLTMRSQIAVAGPEHSLAIVDPGGGRGTVLSVAYSLPPETQAYLLDPDPARMAAKVEEIRPLLEGRSLVLLVFTIDRGAMESDKTALYAPITAILAEEGFARAAAPPGAFGAKHYAKWVRADETD